METKSPTRKTTEAREQSLVVMWTYKKSVRDLMPALRWLHHSPNGEKRDARTGNKLKAMGVKPGFPDLMLPVRSGTYPGLVVEMKSASGRPSDEQKAWMQHFQDEGWAVAIARSAAEARVVLCCYLDMDPYAMPPLDA